MILAFYLLLIEISVWNSTLICKLKALSASETEIGSTDMLFGIFRTIWQVLLKIDSERFVKLRLASLMF